MYRSARCAAVLVLFLAIVGSSVFAPRAHAAGVTDLGVLPGGADSTAHAINDAGQIAGAAAVAGDTYSGFFWENGVMTEIVRPGWRYSGPIAMNAAGVITGAIQNATGFTYVNFTWSAGVLTDLPALPGGFEATANAINAAGMVVGDSAAGVQFERHAAVWTP